MLVQLALSDQTDKYITNVMTIKKVHFTLFTLVPTCNNLSKPRWCRWKFSDIHYL